MAIGHAQDLCATPPSIIAPRQQTECYTVHMTNQYSDNEEYIYGLGLVTYTLTPTGELGVVLDTYYPTAQLGDAKVVDAWLSSLKDGVNTADREMLSKSVGDVPERNIRRVLEPLAINRANAPISAQDVYLRLTALSKCLILPNSVNLEGLFGRLNNVVWTNFGPCAVDNFEETRAKLTQKFGFAPTVLLIDKIPRMVDYVVPDGVRIGNADRVRLGAHLAPGTTVMHEGFVNFNAGTTGTSMVEGRISQGVIVGDGSDIGGGASIMGTLSGGGREVVKIGMRSLLGANAGLGIALGDDCVVEAGLYITAGTKVEFEGDIYKARDLSGLNSLLFMRNSLTGRIIVKKRAQQQTGVDLNSALHKN
jgi:2,3,4,5-tetrahydropyridine-2-carboxylate N-succinyltransferase